MTNPQTSPLLPVYHRADLVMVRGEGVYLYDETGRRYLDFASGIAVNSLGHCHPHVVKALREQAGVLWHCSNLYETPEQNRFASRLVQHSFADTVFFTNSGNEAVETGIKMLRRYHFAKGQPRPRIITVSGSFHGRSMACISAGKNARAVEGFGPLLDGFDQVPFGDFEALKAAVTPETGGILLETVQGEGGVRPLEKAYLQNVRSLCNDKDLLLFLDEVQCGMGRTGTLFAFESCCIAPDICSVAKGIGTGFPLGACLASAKAASGMVAGSHGGTYGGNPLAMAVGNAVLDCLLEDGFLTAVAERGAEFKAALEHVAYDYPALFHEARGVGLMLGLRTKVSPYEMVTALRLKGLLTAAASGDQVVRLLPPLLITSDHVNEAIQAIRDACGDWR